MKNIDDVINESAAKANPEIEPTLRETNEVTKDNWSITLPKTRIHTLPELLKYFEVDESLWEVERFIANKWDMGYVVKKEGSPSFGEASQHELYQVKAFLKRKKNIVNAKNEIEELKSLAKLDAKVPAARIKTKELRLPSGNMLEINLNDVHFGKLAWGAETGKSNYDVKIATSLFNRAFDTLVQRTSTYKFDEIWFVVGNDILNADDLEGRTTKGTYVSSDIRFHKTFATVRNVAISSIEKLRQITPRVKVIMVSGNHDRRSVWHLGDSLECYFHNYKDVEIDNSPRYYKAHQFGKVMIMYTHGDKGKRKNYPLMMATEWPEIFGSAQFREAHTGHNHTDRVEEQHGVKVRTLSALCAPDGWHAENAFVGNLRSSEAFVWNKDEGLIGTAIYTDSDENIEKASQAKTVEEAPVGGR